MQAIILAGGRGTRLRPYTTVLPKPLMPVGDYPILEIVIRQLHKSGFRQILMAVGYLGELLEAYLGDGSKWGVKILYSREQEPLGTAGPVALFDGLEENFLVMNGDILTDLDYAAFFAHHQEKQGLATIATYDKKVKIDLGIIETETGGLLKDYIEKPVLSYSVSMGIYAFSRQILGHIPRGQYLDFPDLIKKLIKQAEPVYSMLFDGYWLDIGRREDYEEAAEDFAELERRFLKDG
tara:strand:- start:669 stop:1379 length:711 start_codon:yes stop_codon:yes gene_type:complete